MAEEKTLFKALEIAHATINDLKGRINDVGSGKKSDGDISNTMNMIVNPADGGFKDDDLKDEP